MANDTPTSALILRSGRVISRMTRTERHHSTSLTSDQNHEVAEPLFPFLKLPAELRIQIYRYLLHSHNHIHIDETYTRGTPDILEKHGWQRFPSRRAEQAKDTALFRVVAIGIHPAILSANRQIYSEASRIMYSENRFDFYGTFDSCRCGGSEAVIPFLESLSEDSRRLIKQIEYVFVVTTVVPLDSDGTETLISEVFIETCHYLGRNLQLKHVVLKFHDRSSCEGILPASEDDLLAVNEKTWEQHLVPLVRGLDTCEFTKLTKDGPGIIDNVQEYLKSQIPRTSRPTFSTRTYENRYPY